MLPQLKKEESSGTLNHSHFANGTLLLGPDGLAGSAHQRAEPRCHACAADACLTTAGNWADWGFIFCKAFGILNY